MPEIQPPPRVLVVQHEEDCPPAMVVPWLAAAGLGCDVVPAARPGALPTAAGDHAGLVVMGGRMGACDDADHPHLAPTRELIARAVAADQPFLGICLGHQLAAVALGGTVRPNPHGKTVGLQPWTPTPDGERDALTGALPAGTQVLHWNDDVVTALPAGAARLGTSPDGTVQAARFAPRAWGVQFHPEVTSAVVDRWREDRDPPREHAALERLRDHEAGLLPVWEGLLRRFATVALAGRTVAGLSRSA